MNARADDAALEDLLGAYALDACDADEVAAVQELLDRRPDVAAEAGRLSQASAWIGATEALTAPEALHSSLLAAVRARRSSGALDAAARCYAASTARLGETIGALQVDEHAELTPNGLTARELVVHLAAQEAALARAVGRVQADAPAGPDIESNTAAFLEEFRGRPLDDARTLWQRSVDAVQAWARESESEDVWVDWLGMGFVRDDMLVIRAFENWIHRDDLRFVEGRPSDPPPVDEIHEMADFSARMMPSALAVSQRSRRGKTARLVLTGAGGGEWLVPMGGDVDVARPPDVTLTADVVEWCRVLGERLEPAALPRRVDGDETLANDLLASAPALAML